jgi:hypothetical protein
MRTSQASIAQGSSHERLAVHPGVHAASARSAVRFRASARAARRQLAWARGELGESRRHLAVNPFSTSSRHLALMPQAMVGGRARGFRAARTDFQHPISASRCRQSGNIPLNRQPCSAWGRDVRVSASASGQPARRPSASSRASDAALRRGCPAGSSRVAPIAPPHCITMQLNPASQNVAGSVIRARSGGASSSAASSKEA